MECVCSQLVFLKGIGMSSCVTEITGIASFYQEAIQDKTTFIVLHKEVDRSFDRLRPVLEVFAAENSDKLHVVTINITRHPELLSMFSVDLGLKCSFAQAAQLASPVILAGRGLQTSHVIFEYAPREKLQELLDASLQSTAQDNINKTAFTGTGCRPS